MATPKGMPPAYSTSAMASKMMEDPAKQKMLRDATAGRDNRAVSNESQVMGQMMAGEGKRLMDMDRIGNELAMRKDDLAFKKRTHDFKKERFGVEMSQRQQEVAQRDRQFYDKLEVQSEGSENPYEGIEMGLGLLSVGANLYGGYKGRQQHKAEMAAMRKLSLAQLGISFNQDSNTQGQEDEDPIPLDLSGVAPMESDSYWSRRD